MIASGEKGTREKMVPDALSPPSPSGVTTSHASIMRQRLYNAFPERMSDHEKWSQLHEGLANGI